MSYTGKNTIFWQNTWFDAQILRGGLYAMPTKG